MFPFGDDIGCQQRASQGRPIFVMAPKLPSRGASRRTRGCRRGEAFICAQRLRPSTRRVVYRSRHPRMWMQPVAGQPRLLTTSSDSMIVRRRDGGNRLRLRASHLGVRAIGDTPITKALVTGIITLSAHRLAATVSRRCVCRPQGVRIGKILPRSGRTAFSISLRCPADLEATEPAPGSRQRSLVPERCRELIWTDRNTASRRPRGGSYIGRALRFSIKKSRLDLKPRPEFLPGTSAGQSAADTSRDSRSALRLSM
jgi:hypothetical protein